MNIRSDCVVMNLDGEDQVHMTYEGKQRLEVCFFGGRLVVELNGECVYTVSV